MTVSDLFRSNLFRAGLLLRLAAVAFLAPVIQVEWFTRFIRETLIAGSIDPWTAFLAAGGDPLAFPYGPVMYFVHAPMVGGGVLADALLGTGSLLAQIGFATSLLIADTMLLLVLCRIEGTHRSDEVIACYWMSPLVLYITYWHGQTDVVPMLMLCLSLLMLKRHRIGPSAVFLGLGISAKLSISIAVPFILLFLWKNRRYQEVAPLFAVTVLATVALTLGIFLLSPGIQTMLLSSPEFGKIYDVSIPVGINQEIYVVPLCFLLLLYGAWRIGRMNYDLLSAFLGLSFFLVLLLTPASVGWYLWVVPFLVAYQLRASVTGRMLVLAFGLVFVGYKWLVSTGPLVTGLGLDLSRPPMELLGPWLTPMNLSLGLSVLTALGLVVAVSMFRRMLRENDFYHLSRRPIAVAIAGDSGTGKDTLSAALAGLFGERSVASISGDDYHLFERKGPLWQAMTHLDPRANDLRSFTTDCLSLMEGKAIHCRHYDHKTGLFTRHRRIKANDVVLISGLHALYSTTLRERLDVRIFLDMDERLRCFFKIKRDVYVRGHTLERVLSSIERRRDDFDKYVRPQMDNVDLRFSLQPARPGLIEDPSYDGKVPLKLRVAMARSILYDDLHRMLVAICGLKVDVALLENGAAAEMTIEGEDVDAEDIRFTAYRLVPHLEDLLAIEPDFKSGMTGLMQLFALVYLAENNQKRQ